MRARCSRCFEREGLSLASILVTHHHADHQGGVPELLAHYPAEVFGPAAESITGISRPLLAARRSASRPVTVEFQVIAVPGHTLGHIAYYGAGCLFCGDTLFAGGCGRLFEGTAAQMADSLARLAALPDETAVYCAHEYTQANLRFALAVEPGNRGCKAARRRSRGARQRLGDGAFDDRDREGEQPLPALRRTGSGGISPRRVPAAADEVAVFAALREWKNGF
jgi:hydroxyacylglutathione hydrolase